MSSPGSSSIGSQVPNEPSPLATQPSVRRSAPTFVAHACSRRRASATSRWAATDALLGRTTRARAAVPNGCSTRARARAVSKPSSVRAMARLAASCLSRAAASGSVPLGMTTRWRRTTKPASATADGSTRGKPGSSQWRPTATT
jgi:hypothetical protein